MAGRITRTHLSVILLVLAGCIIHCMLLEAGDLEPPAPPGPTMKTLDQVEPRIPIGQADMPKTINAPGSYYLTSNLSGRITITSGDVTLDLMGYTVSVTSGDAVDIPSGNYRNLLIRNGVVKARSGICIDARYLSDSSSRFEKLRIEGNQTTWAGLFVGSGCVIEDCQITLNKNYGVNVATAGKCEIQNCIIADNVEIGLQAVNNVRIIGNTIRDNGTAGLKLTGQGSCVAENIVEANGNNYDLAPGNQLNLLLCELPEVISQPAVVKLAGSLRAVSGQNAITVDANDVTIDLAGHTLEGVPGSLVGIYMENRANVEVRDGTIRDFGLDAIREIGSDACCHRIVNVRAISNSTTQLHLHGGIFLSGHNHLVKDCTVSGNPYYGIYVSINSAVTGNVCSDNTGGGIAVYGRCTIIGNTICDNQATGLDLGAGYSLIDQNTVEGNSPNSYPRGSCSYGLNVGL